MGWKVLPPHGACVIEARKALWIFRAKIAYCYLVTQQSGIVSCKDFTRWRHELAPYWRQHWHLCKLHVSCCFTGERSTKLILLRNYTPLRLKIIIKTFSCTPWRLNCIPIPKCQGTKHAGSIHDTSLWWWCSTTLAYVSKWVSEWVNEWE